METWPKVLVPLMAAGLVGCESLSKSQPEASAPSSHNSPSDQTKEISAAKAKAIKEIEATSIVAKRELADQLKGIDRAQAALFQLAVASQRQGAENLANTEQVMGDMRRFLQEVLMGLAEHDLEVTRFVETREGGDQICFESDTHKLTISSSLLRAPDRLERARRLFQALHRTIAAYGSRNLPVRAFKFYPGTEQLESYASGELIVGTPAPVAPARPKH